MYIIIVDSKYLSYYLNFKHYIYRKIVNIKLLNHFNFALIFTYRNRFLKHMFAQSLYNYFSFKIIDWEPMEEKNAEQKKKTKVVDNYKIIF